MLAGVWLRTSETEISAAQWAYGLREGLNFFCFNYMVLNDLDLDLDL